MTLVINKTTYQIPYADLLRPLTETEYNELKTDIEANGITYPVIVDESNNVIDGQHRLQIAAGLGLADIPFQILVGLSEEEKREKALNLNLHRRQLSKEDRQKLAVEMRRNGQSYRVIGEKLGISKSQIERDLSTVPFGTVEELPQVITGKDGKQRPATRGRSCRRWALPMPYRCRLRRHRRCSVPKSVKIPSRFPAPSL